jgi:outer membrane receptor protein involved in Fe transport
VFTQLDSRYRSTNAAMYGETSVRLARPWQVRIGARLEHRSADYEDSNGIAFDPGQTMAGGHVSLERTLSNGGLWYTTVSRGYKAGGFNIGISVPEDRRTFAAEYLWNYETGIKGTWLNGRLAADTALFYMRRRHEQVSSSFQVDPGDPLSFIFFTDNARSGENYGLESSLSWAAGHGLSFGGALGVLETRYIHYQFSDTRSLDGREQAHAPQYQLTLTGEYRNALGLFARVDAQRVDNFYFDTSNDEQAPARTVVNLKLGYERERWAAYLWARNLFDEHYAVRGFFFGNEPPDFIPKRYVQPGDPRQVGVTFNYSFR